jgi:hypothetical protein
MTGDSPTTPGRPHPPPPGPPGPPPEAPPTVPPVLPPAYGAPPPPGKGPGLLWLWVLIGVTVLAAIGVGAYFLLARDEEPAQARRDGLADGDPSTVSVQAGLCDPAVGTTPIDVAIEPPDSASVTVTGGDGFEQMFTATGGSAPVGPGEYTWSAQPAQGFTITGETTGTLTIAPCEEGQTAFTPQEQELLGHVPVGIRDSCQQVPEEEQLGRATASLLCESEGTTLFYDLFANTSDMETYFNSRVREFDITPGSGFCNTAERAENAYVRSRGDQQFEVGRLLCFRDGGAAVFIWTDRRVDISVEAQRDDPSNNQLYRLWAEVEFGPLL